MIVCYDFDKLIPSCVIIEKSDLRKNTRIDELWNDFARVTQNTRKSKIDCMIYTSSEKPSKNDAVSVTA